MALLQLVRVNVGEVGVLPGSVKMTTTDNLATITAAGYLNGLNNQIGTVKLAPSDLIECLYSFNKSTGTGLFAVLSVSINDGVVTLTAIINPGVQYLPLAGGNLSGALTTDSDVLTQLRSGFLYFDLIIPSTPMSPVNSNFVFVMKTAGLDVAALTVADYPTKGFFFVIKNVSGGSGTFTPFAGDLIDGAGSLSIGSQEAVFIALTSDAAGNKTWSTIAKSSLGGGGVTSSQVQLDAFNYAQDFGGVNAYSVALTPAVTSYASATGLYVDMLAISTNTGAATMNSGGGALPIHNQDGSPLAANAILNGGQYRLTINPALNAWILSNTSLAAAGGVTSAQVQQNAFNFFIDSGAPNFYVGTLSPAPISITPGMPVTMFTGNANTGISRLNINGLGNLNILNEDGSNLAAGAIINNGIYNLVANNAGSAWVLMNTSLSGGGTSNWVSYGTNSEKLTDGSGTQTGTNSVTVGVSSPNNAGSQCLVFGSNLTMGSGCQNSVLIGENGSSIGSGSSGCANFGNSNIIGSSNFYAFTAGNGNTINSGAYWGVALGASNTLNATHQVAIGKNANVTNSGSMILCDSANSNNPPTDNAVDQFVSKFSGGFRWYVSNTQQSFGVDASGNLYHKYGMADQSYSRQVPTNAFAITIAAGIQTLVLAPASQLATGTITMPASPIDGQIIRVSAQAFGVTALTVSANAGQTISNPPVALAPANGFMFIYNLANTNWMPLYQANSGRSVSGRLANATPTLLVTVTDKTVISIALPDGSDWLVTGNVFFNISGNCTSVYGAISNVNNTAPDLSSVAQIQSLGGVSGTSGVTAPSQIFAGGQTVYLIANSTFTTGTVTASGTIIAVPV
jgi:hypothetical protein